MNKFTRGEWKAYEDGSIDVSVDGKIVHGYLDVISVDDEALAANAKLIAAAPEMYEVLKSLSYRTSGMEQHEVLQIRELLARIDSEGENE